MPIVLLGLIGVGAALLLIYYSKRPSGTARTAGAKRVQATVVPDKHYKTSDDGKVVYLFDEDADDAADKATDDVPPTDGPDDGGEE
jgi:hypothetical protein